MITKLRGTLDALSDTFAIIDVGGVGYQVHCSARSLGRLPAVGETVSLLTELIIREDAHMLLGFSTSEEREWYRLLISVQGVGMRVALSLLSLGEPPELAAAISSQDKTFIARAEGVGPKLAARIVNELKDKVVRLGFSTSTAKVISLTQSRKPDLPQDAVSALINLGYRQNEAIDAIEMAVRECGKDVMIEQLIRTGLARLARS
ncbi:Holliday junction ATP-dependent DNA helicase RuvA [Caedimonas varicaedens]|uniref:Holliday junction branch migration complex subunit RuvA n=1 Tax=Caedimonas varicaedens TaxID=1629334 RepID=A0A0K8MDI9_9PROT|nr:Holliday junction ATP-dependent DNA helicase RuvA [Caedimonas varicaedens]